MSSRYPADSAERPSRRGRTRSRERFDYGDKHDRQHPRSYSPRNRRPREGDSEDGRSRPSRYSRSRSPEPKQKSRSPNLDWEKRKRRHSRSTSRSSSSSEGDRRKRKKEKHRRRSSSKDKKERKKDKKKDKKKKKSSAVTAQWGKYGIITEIDLYNKEQEFRAWLLEERKINLETLSKENTKKEFARFTEDYNTATLPHEKYYSMEQYEHRMNALRHGELLPAGDESYDPNVDLRAHQAGHKKKASDKESYLSREQLMELRKVQNERIEAGKMKLLGMEIKQSMGVRMDGNAFEE